MPSLHFFLNEIHATGAELVAVSKGRSIAQILSLYHLGVRDFGENRVNEALEKMSQLPQDIRWHFIGRLQSNKISKVVGKFALIHSVDSPELVQKIEAMHIPQKILLQVNVSGEQSKAGLSPHQWLAVFPELLQLSYAKVEGLMTIAPLTEDISVIQECFRGLKKLQKQLQQQSEAKLPMLSMGMSHDWQIALREGATLVRIGRALFETGS